MYARSDVVYANNIISLSELKLVEAELWVRNNPINANILAE